MVDLLGDLSLTDGVESVLVLMLGVAIVLVVGEGVEGEEEATAGVAGVAGVATGIAAGVAAGVATGVAVIGAGVALTSCVVLISGVGCSVTGFFE